jgi:hypothetical protein
MKTKAVPAALTHIAQRQLHGLHSKTIVFLFQKYIFLIGVQIVQNEERF